MYALFDPESPARGVVMAEVNRSYLWQVAEGRPARTELYLLDRSKNILFSSLPIESGREDGFLASLKFGHSGVLEWDDNTGAYLAAYSTIFLEPSFLSPVWLALLRQPRDEALAPIVEFKKAFPLIIVISLCVVFLLSFSQIQRTTRPIEVLREATQKIAQGAWGTKLEIKSGDEFESLGASFNEMSEKLKEGRALLVQAAKLSTMGQMAAGVIHEIKQPLSAIDGLLQLVMMNEHPPQQRKNLEIASGAVERLDAILERFRSFSRASQEKMEPLSLAHVIGQVQALMEHQFMMKKIRCTVDAEENLPPVLGDQQGLHQVFSNLIINAVQAMEDKSEGQRDLDIRLHSSGVNVLAEVHDTGCGMSADVMKRIFDPFFTTKDQDKGTGLGMAIVESILHRHGARIEVDSEVGAGTTLTLTFTAAPKEYTPRELT
jgi:signal transduction histidine kinase